MGSPWLLLLLLLPLLYVELRKENPGYQLCLQEEVVVQEGLCVRVSCSFTFPRAPEFNNIFAYWYREKDYSIYATPVATNNIRWRKTEATDRFFLLGNPYDLNCSLGIKDVRFTDQGTYFFRLEQGYEKYSYKAKKLYLNVTALTEKPVIHVAEPLVSGHPGRLTCSLPGACVQSSLQFSWLGEMLNGTTVTSPELSLTPGPQDHGKNLSCWVRHQGIQRTTKRTIRLKVSYAPRNLTTHVSFKATSVLKIQKNTSALPVQEGQTAWLLCEADSNPPAEFSWFRRSPGLNATILSLSTAKLELRLPEATEDTEFICQAKNPLGSQNASLKLSVFSYPQLLAPTCSREVLGLRCNCSASAQPSPSLHWWLDQELLQENRNNDSFQVTSSFQGPWVKSSLSLREGFGTGLTVRCEAQNDHGVQSAWVLLPLLPGKPETLSATLPPILGAAGVLALLSLCLCLVAVACVVKARRNVASAGSGAGAREDPVMDSVAWDSRTKQYPDSTTDQACPASEEAQELHYANLSFHGMKQREPEDHKGPGTTEYSEIKTSK